jgi:uncharacterized protein YcfL
MKKKSLLFIVLSIFLFFSCEKDEINTLTDGEKIAIELKQVASKENITLATTYVITYSDGNPWLLKDKEKQSFSFENQFIWVGGTAYNLSKLTKFYYVKDSQPYYFELYFQP